MTINPLKKILGNPIMIFISVIIIGIAWYLVSCTISFMSYVHARQREASLRNETRIGSLIMSIHSFVSIYGRLPNDINELHGGNDRKIIFFDSMKSVYGHDYIYEYIDDKSAKIICYGKDGNPGGEDSNGDWIIMLNYNAVDHRVVTNVVSAPRKIKSGNYPF